jgi:molybdenum cofactor cytidylyltransferase
LLPWAEGRTFIEHIVHQLFRERIDPITVVTGHYARVVKNLLKPLDVDIVHNKAYKAGEMLSSLKAGLAALPSHLASALVVLGDQPRIQQKTIYQLLTAYASGQQDILVPSYEMQRGHPILLGRRYWGEVQNLAPDASLRDLLNAHADRIAYVNVDNDSVLRDVDTPQDYKDERWRAGLS